MKEQTKMKTIEQLKKLEKNPNYTLTDEERQVLQSQQYTGLDQLPEEPTAEQRVSSTKHTEENKKKLTKENVAAKDVGRVNKHPSDPVAE